MQLFVIRHTKVNVPEGLCYGCSDVNTAETFEQEKDTIIKKLNEISFDIIYTSPLSRCVKLAKCIANETIPVIMDEKLKELNFGEWEGKFWNDIEKTAEAQKWFQDYVNTQCPGGESFATKINLIREFLNELKQKPEFKKIAIVCHAGTIRAFQIVLNLKQANEVFQQKIDFGEIFYFEI